MTRVGTWWMEGWRGTKGRGGDEMSGKVCSTTGTVDISVWNFRLKTGGFWGFEGVGVSYQYQADGLLCTVLFYAICGTVLIFN